jgi:hypothetical protein
MLAISGNIYSKKLDGNFIFYSTLASSRSRLFVMRLTRLQNPILLDPGRTAEQSETTVPSSRSLE